MYVRLWATGDVHVKDKQFHQHTGKTKDSINRITLSRKMAVLPQNEALQLQPAIAHSLEGSWST